MLHLLTDAKNFTLGTVKEPFKRAAHWGSIMLGLAVPAVVVAALTGTPALVIAFVGAVGAATVAGAAVGLAVGGIKEVMKKRDEYEHDVRNNTSHSSSQPVHEHGHQHTQEQAIESTRWRDHVTSDQLSLNLQMSGAER